MNIQFNSIIVIGIHKICSITPQIIRVCVYFRGFECVNISLKLIKLKEDTMVIIMIRNKNVYITVDTALTLENRKIDRFINSFQK